MGRIAKLYVQAEHFDRINKTIDNIDFNIDQTTDGWGGATYYLYHYILL